MQAVYGFPWRLAYVQMQIAIRCMLVGNGDITHVPHTTYTADRTEFSALYSHNIEGFISIDFSS